MANREKAAAIHGEAFCRMWEFYLAGSEAGFRFQGLVVYQIQLVKNVNALPITRNYIHEVEAALAAGEADAPRLLSGTR
jgi:cyclopropane-fatty-acyl-phospholipid synthase